MRWIAVLGFALLLLGLASACITFPTVEIGKDNLTVETSALRAYNSLPSDYPSANLTAAHFDRAMAGLYPGAWERLNLSEAETSTIWDFVRNGYSVKKMSTNDYLLFLASAAATNADPTTCNNYPAVAYENGFAGYVLATNKYDFCPTYRCSTGAYTPFANDLTTPVSSEASPTASPQATDSEASPTASPSSTATGGAPQFPWDGIIGGSASAPTPSPEACQTPTPSAGSDYTKYLAGGTAVVILFAAALAFSIIVRRQPELGMEVDDLTVHRTLSSETRVGLLRELQQRDLTPTDLSTKVRKSKATVVEHLDRLIDARLVEKIERDGRKFVFYRLTPKGKAVLRRAG